MILIALTRQGLELSRLLPVHNKKKSPVSDVVRNIFSTHGLNASRIEFQRSQSLCIVSIDKSLVELACSENAPLPSLSKDLQRKTTIKHFKIITPQNESITFSRPPVKISN